MEWVEGMEGMEGGGVTQTILVEAKIPGMSILGAGTITQPASPRPMAKPGVGPQLEGIEDSSTLGAGEAGAR